MDGLIILVGPLWRYSSGNSYLAKLRGYWKVEEATVRGNCDFEVTSGEGFVWVT